MTTHQSTTNAGDIDLASHLAEIEGETIVSLVTQKKGKNRGREGDKKTYGDDTVHVLIWAGWDYTNLVKLSLAYLRKYTKGGRPVMSLVNEAQRHDHKVTVEDACLAIQELRDSFYETLTKRAGNGDWDETCTGGSRKSEQWIPLEVNGIKYPTLKVYIGPPRPDPKSPIPGHIYIHGLKLGERVLVKAANGPWSTNSSGKTIAKRLLKRQLPVGRYVSYALAPGHTINLGGQAVKAASMDGVSIDPGAVLSLFKIAKEASKVEPPSPAVHG